MIFPLWPSGPPVLDGIDSPQNNVPRHLQLVLCPLLIPRQGHRVVKRWKNTSRYFWTVPKCGDWRGNLHIPHVTLSFWRDPSTRLWLTARPFQTPFNTTAFNTNSQLFLNLDNFLHCTKSGSLLSSFYLRLCRWHCSALRPPQARLVSLARVFIFYRRIHVFSCG